MKITLTTSEVAQHLMDASAMGNESGCYSLCYTMAEWLEQLEDDTGEEMELDPIAIRCEFSPYTLEELEEMYTIPDDADPLEWLIDRTIVIETDIEDTYIIQEF